MKNTLSPVELTCKMIGEKYGHEARELLRRIKERKENVKSFNTTNKALDKSIK
jgi:hypothetical protein